VEGIYAVLEAELFQQATFAVKIVREGLVRLDRRVDFAVLMLYAAATLLVPV
jgi:hypothetical protein